MPRWGSLPIDCVITRRSAPAVETRPSTTEPPVGTNRKPSTHSIPMPSLITISDCTELPSGRSPCP